MTIMVKEIQEIYQAGLKKGLTAEEALRETRTLVHAKLQLDNPPPYSDHPGHLPKDRPGKFSHSEMKEIHAHQHAQVTDEERLASEKAREGIDGNHVNAHHYVQKEHGKSLWKETDRLVQSAGLGTGGAS